MTPLVKVAKRRARWVAAAALYTIAGAISSMTVGSALGTLGSIAGFHCENLCWRESVLCLALLLAAVEADWFRWSLHGRRRQTEKMWANRFGLMTASAMWGFDLGLGVTTRINYAGYWMVFAACVIRGRATAGMALMLAYWIGRTLPVW